MTDALGGMLSNQDPDPANSTPIDMAPVTQAVPGAEAPLPPGVHPGDQSVPIGADGSLVEHDKPPSSTGPATAPGTNHKPWAQENADAFPVFQRASHDWAANAYTLQSTDAPIQLSGRLKGKLRTTVWVPTGSAKGVVVSPDQGDIQQGAGITINPGDPPLNIDSEGPVWAGVIPGQATGGPVQVVTYFNPLGGNFGLSSS
jgi:hypothetical protein